MTNPRSGRSPDTDTSMADAAAANPLPHVLYDPILWEWRLLAAIAWEGYLASGAGHVLVEVDAGVRYRYLPGAPCDCHAGMVDDYDPETQIVVAVRHAGDTLVHCLAGWPEPPSAWALLDATAAGAAVH